MVTLTREQLRQLRHIPDQAASLQPGRLEAALRRLNEMYMWQTIDVDEYQHQRAELTTKLAEMPPPVESNLIAFDRAASRLLPMGKVICETSPEHQQAIVRHIVGRVE